MVELVDTLDLGSSAARCESSSLSARTSKGFENKMFSNPFFMAYCFIQIAIIFIKLGYYIGYKGWFGMYSKKKRNLKSGGRNIPVFEFIVVVVIIILLIYLVLF